MALFDGTYVRVKNIEIGYSLSRRSLRFANLQSCRFYFQGMNLLTFDKLGDIDVDPEIKEGSGDWYPVQRVFNFGVSINY